MVDKAGLEAEDINRASLGAGGYSLAVQEAADCSPAELVPEDFSQVILALAGYTLVSPEVGDCILADQEAVG